MKGKIITRILEDQYPPAIAIAKSEHGNRSGAVQIGKVTPELLRQQLLLVPLLRCKNGPPNYSAVLLVAVVNRRKRKNDKS